MLIVLLYYYMEQDIVLATLGKLKRQNEEITAQK